MIYYITDSGQIYVARSAESGLEWPMLFYGDPLSLLVAGREISCNMAMRLGWPIA